MGSIQDELSDGDVVRSIRDVTTVDLCHEGMSYLEVGTRREESLRFMEDLITSPPMLAQSVTCLDVRAHDSFDYKTCDCGRLGWKYTTFELDHFGVTCQNFKEFSSSAACEY